MVDKELSEEIKKFQDALELDFILGIKDAPHYQTDSKYDVIDFCKDYDLNFNRGNIVKYIARAGKKENELKDLQKAFDYLTRELEFLSKE